MIPEKTTDEFCAITEQGDLGLGAEVLGAADQEVLKEQQAKEENQETKERSREKSRLLLYF